nr:UbiD family decarboxylase [Saprospiraceae bacterium]
AQEFPGLKEIHAVDAAGVHPLLLAIGKERYMPFREPRPEEILTIANRILGSGQTSLAKYLIIAADEDDPSLDTHDIATFFKHVLERIDWQRDLHFQTKTTIDTLDYSGEDWNGGSKVVWACRSSQIRKLAKDLPIIPENTIALSDIKVVLPGILAYSGPKFTNYDQAKNEVDTLIDNLEKIDLEGFPLIILCDDASFTAESLNNFVWVTFT